MPCTLTASVLLAALLVRGDEVINYRIVGGEDAKIEEAPYQVATIYKGDLFCGGSIISNKVIVSAAHCVRGKVEDWEVRAGSNRWLEAESHKVAEMIKHEKYSTNKDYDISLYVLKSELLPDGVTVKAIELAHPNQVLTDKDKAFITGWGRLSVYGKYPEILQKITVPIVDQEACAEAYAPRLTVSELAVCAGLLVEGGKSSCHGDSGGPLVVDGVLSGITSWGRGCADPGYPGVYTRVSLQREWIDSHLKQITQCARKVNK